MPSEAVLYVSKHISTASSMASLVLKPFFALLEKNA